MSIRKQTEAPQADAEAPRTLSDELRRLVRERMAAGVTRYQIAKDAGFRGGTFYDWLDDPISHGAGQTLDRIAAYLGVGIGAIDEKSQKKLSTKTPSAKRLTAIQEKTSQNSVIPD